MSHQTPGDNDEDADNLDELDIHYRGEHLTEARVLELDAEIERRLADQDAANHSIPLDLLSLPAKLIREVAEAERDRSSDEQPPHVVVSQSNRHGIDVRAAIDEYEAAEEAQDQNEPYPPGTWSHPNRHKAVVLEVRVSPEEYEQIKALAHARELPISTFVRACLLDVIEGQGA